MISSKCDLKPRPLLGPRKRKGLPMLLEKHTEAWRRRRTRAALQDQGRQERRRPGWPALLEASLP